MKHINNERWDFVEKYYPNYYSSDVIAHNDDLRKLLIEEHEDGDCASELLKNDYNNDLNNGQIQEDFNKSLSKIYGRSIDEYMKEQEKTKGLEVQKVLVLSTGHLPFKEFKEIKVNAFVLGNKNTQCPFRVIEHEYGMELVFMDMDETTKPMYEKMYNEYPYLSKIYSLIQANKIKRIDFDQDGEKIDDLMYFDW